MNDKFTTDMNSDENVVRKLKGVANETNINAQFYSKLEEKLRDLHRPKRNWFMSAFQQVSPMLRWVALMILLGLVLSWSINTLIPAPQPSTDNTAVPSTIATPTPDVLPDGTSTPVAEEGGFDWRGTKLYLAAPLPQFPTEANVYLLKPDQHATIEEARALAQRFGIQGEIHQAPGELPNTTDYMITDGKQRLYVRSENYFTYYADYNANIFLKGGKFIDLKPATVAITTFLGMHGFEDEYFIEQAPQISGNFYAIPYLPDGHALRYDHNLPARMEFVVTDNGEILSVTSAKIDYVQIGSYGIRSAEEVFQEVLNSSEVMQNGVLESVRDGGILNERFWERSYPDDQTITIYGQPISYPAVEAGQPPFISIDSYRVKGNTEGMETLKPDTLVEATGQFTTENGIRTFKVESWTVSDATEHSTPGSLRRKENGQVVLWISSVMEYPIPDAPQDVPLDTLLFDSNSPLWVSGFMTDEGFYWKTIQYFPDGALNQGGGGGGGTGFYKLNLSGTPVPFPSPMAHPAIDSGFTEYIVQEGDTLITIAQNFGITVDELMQANDLTEPMIFVGQALVIPGAQSEPSITEYVVQENDTAASIALNFGISVEELRQANDLPENNLIFVDQTLFIPGQQEDNPIVDRRFEGQRGTLVISIYNQIDGNSHEQFTFVMKNADTSLSYALLEDVSFEALLPYHHRPINIWGTVNRVNENGIPIISVERYDVLFPGLTFQLVLGMQQTIEIDGISATLFTTDEGKSYVQISPDGSLDNSIIGNIGDQVYAEALMVPDEIVIGYPAMRVFNMGMAVNPKNGEPATITITADQPYVLEEEASPGNYTPPTATIEKVELVYYIPDPRYATPAPNTNPQYVQPGWRFYGHYSNGDEFEILVQALKHEFLFPELAPSTPPG